MDEAVWGVNPVGIHLQSLWWHLLCVGLLFRLLQGFVDRSAAWAAAAVFALHPALSESVVWISARNDLMATAFLLGMLLGLSKEQPNWHQSLLGWLCFFAAGCWSVLSRCGMNPAYAGGFIAAATGWRHREQVAL